MKMKKIKVFQCVCSMLIAILIMIILIIHLVNPGFYEITPTIIWMISLLILLLAINVFDYISFGKVSFIRNENDKLSKINEEYRRTIINYISNNTINNSNKLEITVNPVSNTNKNDDVNEKEVDKLDRKKQLEDFKNRKERNNLTMELVVEKYCNKYNIKRAELQTVEFTDSYDSSDPIMNKKIIIDKYYKDHNFELFIEVKQYSYLTMMHIYDLYVKLNKMYRYKMANNTNVKMVLLLFGDETIEDKRNERNLSDYKKYFEPAIKNGLLEIIRYNSDNGALEIV